MNEDLDILGFDPSALRVFGENTRKLNYPYSRKINCYESKTNNAEDIIAYILDSMTRNSIEHEELLVNNQYDKKDTWHDNHHSSWERQVLDWKFYANIYRKMNKIMKCVDRLKEHANTYSISKQVYNTWKANMVNYIWDGNSNKQQIEWFVEGLIKFIFSAAWDYNNFSWILENPICSSRYEFSTETWKKINDK